MESLRKSALFTIWAIVGGKNGQNELVLAHLPRAYETLVVVVNADQRSDFDLLGINKILSQHKPSGKGLCSVQTSAPCATAGCAPFRLSTTVKRKRLSHYHDRSYLKACWGGFLSIRRFCDTESINNPSPTRVELVQLQLSRHTFLVNWSIRETIKCVDRAYATPDHFC